MQLNKYIKLCLVATGVLCFGSANAQDAIFRVLATKGDCATKSSDAKQNLTVGKKVFKQDVVEVGNGSYLGLMHKTGKTLELKSPGTYTVSDLEGKLAVASSSTVSSKYANYVFGQMANNEGADLKKNHQQYMAVTGAVMRALPASSASSLKAFIPNNSPILAAQTYNITWMGNKSVTEYIVTVTDMYNEPVYSTTVTDTAVNINFGSIAKLKNESMCLVEIAAKNNPRLKTNEVSLRLVSGEKTNTVNKDLSDFSKDSDPNTALGLMIRASYFEEQELFLDALNAYRLAAIREPEVETFKAAYQDALQRYGLLEDPKKVEK